MVARNNNKEIILIQTFKSEITIPEVVELEAILRALQVASSYGWNNILIESDAISVIQSLASRDTKHLNWKAEHFANSIFLLVLFFANVSFVWTNRAAHHIGQWAKHNRFYGEVNINSLPFSIVLFLNQDSDANVTT